MSIAMNIENMRLTNAFLFSLISSSKCLLKTYRNPTPAKMLHFSFVERNNSFYDHENTSLIRKEIAKLGVLEL